MFKALSHVKFRDALAFYVVSLVFAYFFIYSFAPLSKDQRDNCREIAIAVIGMGSLIFNFIYGSSSSSARKDEVISNMAGTGPAKAENVETMNVISQGAAPVAVQWKMGGTYNKGDKVISQGITYEAQRDFFQSNSAPENGPPADWKAL